jgi:hypothetical protein
MIVGCMSMITCGLIRIHCGNCFELAEAGGLQMRRARRRTGVGLRWALRNANFGFPMICPQCKCEYVDGVTHCADCDVDLVESLADPHGDAVGTSSDAELRGVWGGEDQEEFAAVSARLKEAGIPFRVNQRGREFLTGLGQYFEIGVPAGSYEQAKEIIDKDFLVAADETNDPSVMELPAEDDDATAKDIDREWDPENWYPEDATVEVWSGTNEQDAAMIEASLRENNVHARTEVAEGGSGKIFVMPGDASRAKEIVREIAEGAPPA